jgi:MinD superfamily P-loop ATPase
MFRFKDFLEISDYVIIDCAAGLGEEALSIMKVADDVIIVNTKISTNQNNVYIPTVTRVQNNVFRISVYVPSAIGSADQPQINFFVLKGTTF